MVVKTFIFFANYFFKGDQFLFTPGAKCPALPAGQGVYEHHLRPQIYRENKTFYVEISILFLDLSFFAKMYGNLYYGPF